MILCPRKNGRGSVSHVNQALLGKNLTLDIMNWDEGTPVVCTENQPELGLSNGDIGLSIGDTKNRRLLFKIFNTDQTLSTSLIHPARVKKVEPAYALTIHKAQGSEAKKVILLWPNKLNKVNSQINSSLSTEITNQKLFYTAITRAKESLEININEDSFKEKET